MKETKGHKMTATSFRFSLHEMSGIFCINVLIMNNDILVKSFRGAELRSLNDNATSFS